MIRHERASKVLGRPQQAPSSFNWTMYAGRFLLLLFVAGGGYLFAVNQNAVQGYQIRNLEKEIAELKDENAELKIAEADLRSLYRLEGTETELQMEKLEEVKYIDEPEPASLFSGLFGRKAATE